MTTPTITLHRTLIRAIKMALAAWETYLDSQAGPKHTDRT
jgi:hypothetical protein